MYTNILKHSTTHCYTTVEGAAYIQPLKYRVMSEVHVHSNTYGHCISLMSLWLGTAQTSISCLLSQTNSSHTVCPWHRQWHRHCMAQREGGGERMERGGGYTYMPTHLPTHLNTHPPIPTPTIYSHNVGNKHIKRGLNTTQEMCHIRSCYTPLCYHCVCLCEVGSLTHEHMDHILLYVLPHTVRSVPSTQDTTLTSDINRTLLGETQTL